MDTPFAKKRRGSGLGSEIGLARGQSPARGERCLNLGSALVHEMPNTMASLALGQISEEHAQVVAKETSWLSSEHRGEVDELIADRFEGLGPRQLAAEVRAHAQRLDQEGAVARLAKATSERRVSVRPAPEGMAYLTALLPMSQAVAMFATLHRDATNMVSDGDTKDSTGQPRTRDQIMPDLLVERTTGQATATGVPAEVQVVMTDAALFGDEDTPSWLQGQGPIPATIAKQWLADPAAIIFIRRVFTRPKDHQLVALESRARNFPKGLRRMIMLRDDVCRAPFCDAPIKDIDHVVPVRQGGTTSWSNASGLCSRCNKIKENTGWRHETTPERLGVTTPTGHKYFTVTGPVLAGIPPDKRPPPDDELTPNIGSVVDIAWTIRHHAA